MITKESTPNTNPEQFVEESIPQLNAHRSYSGFWRGVIVGGVPGIMIGAGVTAVTSSALNKLLSEAIRDFMEAEESEMSQTDVQEGSDVGGSSSGTDSNVEIREANSVDDEMSFGEAFASARAEVGPYGAFVWHGRVFCTFRADDPEWQAMSTDERLAHSEAILSQVHAGPYTPTDHEPDFLYEDFDWDDGPGEHDIYINGVGVEEWDGEGTIQVGYGEVDGMDALFADTDGDGVVDTVYIEGEEVSPDSVFENGPMTMEEMAAEAEFNESEMLDDTLYADMPDYVNDADTGDFA